jgi:hypothetical protein
MKKDEVKTEKAASTPSVLTKLKLPKLRRRKRKPGPSRFGQNNYQTTTEFAVAFCFKGM